MLKFLIENDGDIFKRDNLGQTILHWGIIFEPNWFLFNFCLAVENDSESIVDYLANKYPNLIKLKCYYGYTPCHKGLKNVLSIFKLNYFVQFQLLKEDQ